jgi:hypothetical protein
MLCREAFIRADISEELSASNIRVTIIGELGKTLAVTSNRSTLRRKKVRKEDSMEYQIDDAERSGGSR